MVLKRIRNGSLRTTPQEIDFKASNVHAKLTLTVIKADSGKIFVTDHSAFIFSLVNKEKSSLVNKYVQSRLFKWLSICNKL